MKKITLLLFLSLLVGLTSCGDFVDTPVNFRLFETAIVVDKGDTYKIAANSYEEVNWDSEDNNIATVDKGVVTGVNTGNTRIRISYYGQKEYVKVTVTDKDVNRPIDFEDKILKMLLLKKTKADKNLDGEISIKEAREITQIDLSVDDKKTLTPDSTVTGLRGLEHFVNLKRLLLKNHEVKRATSIENLKELRVLHLGGNKLSAIDLTKLVNLDSLLLFNNPDLKYLDVKKNVRLRELFLQSLPISTLDLSECQLLERVFLNNSQLTSLTLGYMPRLKRLDVVKNNLQNFVVKDLPELKELHLDNNKLTSVVVEDAPKLQLLNVYGNQLGKLEIKKAPELMMLFAFDNEPLSMLDLSACAALHKIMVSNTAIEELNLSACPHIASVEAEYCAHLKQVDLKNGGFDSENAEYMIRYGNNSLSKIRVDAGAEENYVKTLFKDVSTVQVVTQ